MSHRQRAVSPAQLAANRANAAKSTGPRTPQGKARSAQNACKHGFTASTFAVVRLEDLQEIAHLRADLVAVYQPVNSQEVFAIERMALAQQTILRAARLESGLFTACLSEAMDPLGNLFIPMSQELAGDGDIEITRAQNRNYALGVGFHRVARQSNSISLMLRYQAQAERQYRRAVEEFERLKALREDLPEQGLPNEAITDPQPEQNEPTCTPSTPNPIPPEDPPLASGPRLTPSGLRGRISKSIPARDMIQKGRRGGDQFETSAVADRRMNWWATDTDRRKDRGVRPYPAQGAHEHEAKEHDLPLVRQGRA